MTGDFTRNTFDPANHYSRVLMQQGRAMLDADWNEQSSILLHYMRTVTADIFGPHAGPASNPGFEIIGKSFPDLDVKLTQLVPPDTKRWNTVREKISSGDALIGPGRYYVNGILVENHTPILYSEQPGYPFSGDPTPDQLKDGKRGVLVYLDVWERHISFEQDDRMREVALGGPDTCSRSQVVWQVRVLLEPPPPPGVERPVFNCKAVDKLPQSGTGRLRARARLDKPPTELCSIPPESRYRGAENQLYRVEVHQGGEATADQSGATFKWSRENGSVVFPILSLSGTTAKLGHLGRDRRSTLNPGDWVEFDDERISLGQGPRVLAQVDTVARDSMTVTLRFPDGVKSLPSYAEADIGAERPLLRRWEHRGDLTALGGALRITEYSDTGQGWIDLEDGVQVWFAKDGQSKAQYQAGDYWLIPARTATGDVEWPHERDDRGDPKLDGDGNPIGTAIGPRGTHHYYAPLLLSTGPIEAPTTTDCRCAIQPLPCVRYRYAFDGKAVGGGGL